MTASRRAEEQAAEEVIVACRALVGRLHTQQVGWVGGWVGGVARGAETIVGL